ncbi:phytanoyl-CoA dioxygenase family protein [Paenibacillus cisolokensis]|jgi:Protein involved in biosynthesis of mitomycin antibiotics/polyketide fumonisin|uniref:phytanoyl-CoA dioxygenase family protein n=1 Tax=Paenibacillus TaxID=44249 RepID=UPI000720D0E3|nr:phytanoyl-CoA dioxygenase family protein [Paenibacillus sp. 32O-W]ALS29845.1 phytanoyl-CoA dioxygenase [Paenibacillus sp. 32O-W]
MRLHGLTEEQYMAWHHDGYLVLEGFLTPEECDRYNAKMDEAFARWRASGGSNPELGQLNHVEQICGIIEHDDAFLELMEHPRMMSIMRDLIGDSFVMIDNDAMLKPPKREAHTNWHRDTGSWLVVNEKPVPFMVKVFYFLSDVDYDGGCLAFLPGSVHMSNDQLPKVERQEDMPGHVRMTVKKGTAVAFHGYLYHSALNNYSDRVRRTLIYNYAPPFVRTWPGYEPSEALRAKATTNLRKMLLGVHPWVSDPKAFESEPESAASAT